MNPILFYEYGKSRIPPIGPPVSTVFGIGIGSGTSKYASGCLAPNGMIYAVPFGSGVTQVLKINPTTNVSSVIGASLGTNKCGYGGVLAPNGMIYYIPTAGFRIVKVDPTTDTITLIGSAIAQGYGMGVLAPNGIIYFGPSVSGATQIAQFDPATEIFSLTGYTVTAGAGYTQGILAPNGYIYYIPDTNAVSARIIKFNPATNT